MRIAKSSSWQKRRRRKERKKETVIVSISVFFRANMNEKEACSGCFRVSFPCLSLSHPLSPDSWEHITLKVPATLWKASFIHLFTHSLLLLSFYRPPVCLVHTHDWKFPRLPFSEGGSRKERDRGSVRKKARKERASPRYRKDSLGKSRDLWKRVS